MRLNRVRGVRVIGAEEWARWLAALEAAREVLRAYNFVEVELPLLEHEALFKRAEGETTDIVEKEMFTLEDRGGRHLALRPEGTPGLVRAVIEEGLTGRLRLAYFGPFFRAERPQRGRFRQFYQLGAELVGDDTPEADAEVICLADAVLDAVGVRDAALLVNSLGCPRDRRAHDEALKRYLEEHSASLCADCRRRMNRNRMRVLDCKADAERLADAPLVKDFLCESCAEHYGEVKRLIGHLRYEEAPRLVRGLDYYGRTTFEFVSSALGAQDALGGGGRYDGLFELLGGKPTPATGFALGMDRMMMVSERAAPSDGDLVCVVSLGHRERARALVSTLRAKGERCELLPETKLSKALSSANKMGAARVYVIGDREVQRGRALLRDMRSGVEEEAERI